MTFVSVGRVSGSRTTDERIFVDVGEHGRLSAEDAEWLRDRIDEELALLDSDGGNSGGDAAARLEALYERTVDNDVSTGERVARDMASSATDEDENTAAPEVFACGDCGKTFDTERGKNIHRSKAHADDDEEHECPTCGDVFDTPIGMKTHHHRVHDVTVDELPDDHDEAKATIEAVDGERESDQDGSVDEEPDADQDDAGDGDTDDQQGQPDLPFGCPVVGCEKRFADRDDRDVHRDDVHDETEVIRGYRERARDDLHDGLSVTDVEAAAAANTRVNDVADVLDTRPRHARKWLNMLQLNPALEEFGERQARHMIEDLHDRLEIDEPLPPMDAEGEGGEAA